MVPAGPVRPPTRLVLLIAASTVIPLGGLLWAGWHLYQQDRQISAGLARQRLEQSTEVVIAALQRALAGSEQRLVAGSDDWPAGAVAVTFEPHAVRLSDPGRLAYLPVPAAQQEVPREVFAEGEALEFRQGGLQAAVEHYRGLTRSPRLPVRAGALLRLARTLQKSGRTQEALDSYEELTGIQGVSELGFDVGLAAIHERARLFARDGRAGELTAEAARLQGS